MPTMSFGLMGPEKLESTRRSNMLGLGSVIRLFNELAVPGLGGLFFAKQPFLALLGVAVAQKASAKGRRVSNIDVANSLEAIGCWLTFLDNGWQLDSRLRGSQKLRNRQDNDFIFDRVRQPNFYVTQPMRMSTVQALPMLGFVKTDSARFNHFTCTDIGHDFIDEITVGLNPNNTPVINYLAKWVINRNEPITQSSKPLFNALSPLQPIPEKARKIFLHKLLEDGADEFSCRQRRQNIWNWIKRMSDHGEFTSDWSKRPSEIDPEHWEDLKAGARFQVLRDKAIELLQQMENLLAQKSAHKMYLYDKDLMNLDFTPLTLAAQSYLNLGYSCRQAEEFARECLSDKPQNIALSLAQRDGTGVRLSGEFIVRGPAFRGNANEASNGEEKNLQAKEGKKLPPDISNRVKNMLNLYEEGKV